MPARIRNTNGKKKKFFEEPPVTQRETLSQRDTNRVDRRNDKYGSSRFGPSDKHMRINDNEAKIKKLTLSRLNNSKSKGSMKLNLQHFAKKGAKGKTTKKRNSGSKGK